MPSDRMRAKTVNPVVVLVVMAIMSAIVLSMAVRGFYLDEQFNTIAHRSQGTVDNAWATAGGKGRTNYHVSYRFLDEVGLPWTDTALVAQATYLRLHAGDIVPVKYLAGDPRQSRIDWPEEDQWHWHESEVQLCAGLVIGGVGFLIWIFRRRKDRRRS